MAHTIRAAEADTSLLWKLVKRSRNSTGSKTTTDMDLGRKVVDSINEMLMVRKKQRLH